MLVMTVQLLNVLQTLVGMLIKNNVKNAYLEPQLEQWIVVQQEIPDIIFVFQINKK
jgi:hypothetical protein